MLRWPHHFFDRAYFNRSALSYASAYIFFRRRFSSLSSFIRATMDTSMPPNLLPLVERRRADAVLAAQFGHGRAAFGLLEHGDDLGYR